MGARGGMRCPGLLEICGLQAHASNGCHARLVHRPAVAGGRLAETAHRAGVMPVARGARPPSRRPKRACLTAALPAGRPPNHRSVMCSRRAWPEGGMFPAARTPPGPPARLPGCQCLPGCRCFPGCHQRWRSHQLVTAWRRQCWACRSKDMVAPGTRISSFGTPAALSARRSARAARLAPARRVRPSRRTPAAPGCGSARREPPGRRLPTAGAPGARRRRASHAKSADPRPWARRAAARRARRRTNQCAKDRPAGRGRLACPSADAPARVPGALGARCGPAGHRRWLGLPWCSAATAPDLPRPATQLCLRLARARSPGPAQHLLHSQPAHSPFGI